MVKDKLDTDFDEINRIYHSTHNFTSAYVIPQWSSRVDSMEIAVTESNKPKSHYDYLEAVIAKFGELVFNKPNGNHFCEGFIGAHGDKCYSYMRDANEEHDIPEHRFAMIYLLTYTSLMDRPKHESYEWVLSNYERFKPSLRDAEKASGIDQYYPD